MYWLLKRQYSVKGSDAENHMKGKRRYKGFLYHYNVDLFYSNAQISINNNRVGRTGKFRSCGTSAAALAYIFVADSVGLYSFK